MPSFDDLLALENDEPPAVPQCSYCGEQPAMSFGASDAAGARVSIVGPCVSCWASIVTDIRAGRTPRLFEGRDDTELPA